MESLPLSVDLSRDRDPESFFVPLIPNRFGLEDWRSNPSCRDHTIPHNNWCATTSFLMGMKCEGMQAPSQEELFNAACRSGVYTWQHDSEAEGGRGWRGAHHRAFACFIQRKKFGFEGKFVSGLNSDDVAAKLADERYALLRVSPDIRFPSQEIPKSKIGHVVFCFGYKTNEVGERCFRIHNCAGFASLNSQIDFEVPESRLLQVFSGDATFFWRV